MAIQFGMVNNVAAPAVQMSSITARLNKSFCSLFVTEEDGSLKPVKSMREENRHELLLEIDTGSVRNRASLLALNGKITTFNAETGALNLDAGWNISAKITEGANVLGDVTVCYDHETNKLFVKQVRAAFEEEQNVLDFHRRREAQAGQDAPPSAFAKAFEHLVSIGGDASAVGAG